MLRKAWEGGIQGGKRSYKGNGDDMGVWGWRRKFLVQVRQTRAVLPSAAEGIRGVVYTTDIFILHPFELQFLLQTHPDLPSFSDTGAHHLSPHFAMAALWHANSWPIGNIFNQLKK